MLNLPQKTVENIKKILTRKQVEVEKNLRQVVKDDPATSLSVAETSEPGTDSSIADSHTKTVVLEAQLEKERTSIKEALVKIKNGTYGKCESCGKSIQISRLLVMPTAKYCIFDSKKISK
ncbi:TraR/DksA C4-type zinc finger protein [Candidatus Woesebacteria bacterium]|nr:TraR/DksA C4-type zinc finger protein [Candidatus Woesebacteria bacterium]